MNLLFGLSASPRFSFLSILDYFLIKFPHSHIVDSKHFSDYSDGDLVVS